MDRTRSVLVRNGRHQRPMVAVLRRYGIGTPDGFNRGLWITEEDLTAIRKGMEADPSLIRREQHLFVRGSNIHNYVGICDFSELFGKRVTA